MATIVAPSQGTVIVPDVDDTFCAGMFGGPLREAIHKFKYQNDTPLAQPLGNLIVDLLAPANLPRALKQEPPTLVPVPLHRDREKSRGYNQCALLATLVAQRTGWPLQAGLIRTRPTASQVGLHLDERRKNVAGAFEWQRSAVPERVVLIDDVCTTGATFSECARALRAVGVKKVYAAAVAKADIQGRHAHS